MPSAGGGSTRQKQQRFFRLFQQRRGGVAEGQLFARAAADPQDDEVVLAARRFLQDRFLSRDIGAHPGAKFKFTALGKLDNVLENGLLVLAGAFLSAAGGDVKRRDRSPA